MPALGELSVDALEAACVEGEQAGHRTSCLLLTNPNNPLGTVYSKEELESVMAWAFKRGIHVVSDEIYAWSVYKNKTKFVSAPTLLKAAAARAHVSEANAANLLHTVLGMSKDFCMSGFRIGWVYTRNETLLKALSNVGYFAGGSNVTQHALAGMLEDADFIDAYMEENCRRLCAGGTTLENALKEAGIPYTPAQGAMFLCIDLSNYLPERTWEAERALFQAFFDEERLLLTPGKDCHFERPGNFRMCFAAVPPGALPEATKRLTRFLAKSNPS